MAIAALEFAVDCGGCWGATALAQASVVDWILQLILLSIASSTSSHRWVLLEIFPHESSRLVGTGDIGDKIKIDCPETLYATS